jgi:ribose-phosphate pyrophosphokinase
LELGHQELGRFPDGESYVRITTPVNGAHCIVLADLSHPDSKYLAHVFLFETLRELGAKSVGLVAPDLLKGETGLFQFQFSLFWSNGILLIL